MKSNHAILLVATLFLLALPAGAQDAPPAVSALQPESPACQGPTSELPEQQLPDLGAPPTVEMIGGERECGAFLPDGSPNPDWPECNGDDGGSLGGASCSGLSSCYCFCRYYHRCDQDPAECDPLAQCLNDCDAQYPGCPYPGGTYPSSISECL